MQPEHDRDRAATEPGAGASGGETPAVGAAVPPERGADTNQLPLGEPPTTLTLPSTQRPGGTTRVTLAQFRENMMVVGSDDEVLGMVDRVDVGGSLKLKADATGEPHWIMISWVARVADQAHLDRPAQQAKQAWLTDPPREDELP